MKLLLTSAGTNVKEEINKILPKPANQLRLAHVITASKPDLNKDYVRKDKQRLVDMGFQVEDIDIEGKTPQELRKTFKNKDIVCVQGGNTFYLLRAVKESGFDIVIKELMSKGAIYIGISAGSYIACPTIKQATWRHQDRNHFGLTDFSALKLVPFIIIAHFEEKYRKIIEDGAKTTKCPIVALYDTQAVLVENNKYKIVGNTKREFFNGFEEKV